MRKNNHSFTLRLITMNIPTETINLLLGIIGTVTGVLALSIHFWRLKRESPNLKIDVIKFEHVFREEKKTLTFWAEIFIRNLGDRGTDILGIDLEFKDNNDQKQKIELNYFRPVEADLIKWIRPHETATNSRTASIEYDADVTEELDCTLIINHTHGSKKKNKSKITKKESPQLRKGDLRFRRFLLFSHL